MSSTPYGQLKDEEMILRDHLAIDRTALANERTFLAYVRTALAAGGAGAVLIHFFEAWPVRILGVVLVAAAVALLLVGLLRYLRLQARLRRPDFE